MTKLGQLLAQRVMRGGFECRSTVTAGTQQGDMEEFRLSQQIPLARLREADSGSLDLGLRQLEGLFVDQESSVVVLDHEVEFEALEGNDQGVAKVLVHARPEAETWRVISDNLFAMGHAHAEAGDEPEPPGMFSVTILVETTAQKHEVQRALRRLHFSPEELRAAGVPPTCRSMQPQYLSPCGSSRFDLESAQRGSMHRGPMPASASADARSTRSRLASCHLQLQETCTHSMHAVQLRACVRVCAAASGVI